MVLSNATSASAAASSRPSPSVALALRGAPKTPFSVNSAESNARLTRAYQSPQRSLPFSTASLRRSSRTALGFECCSNAVSSGPPWPVRELCSPTSSNQVNGTANASSCRMIRPATSRRAATFPPRPLTRTVRSNLWRARLPTMSRTYELNVDSEIQRVSVNCRCSSAIPTGTADATTIGPSYRSVAASAIASR